MKDCVIHVIREIALTVNLIKCLNIYFSYNVVND